MTKEQNGLFPEIDPARIGNGRRRRRLFLPKYLEELGRDEHFAGADREAARAILSRWADLELANKLKRRKESALESEFLTQVFGEALGYTLFSQDLATWQLEPKLSVPGGQADAAIGEFGREITASPRVVIELEGPDINVDRYRSQGRTPVQQCWDYLNALPQCPWGIVCNIVSFRLYHRNRTPVAYELFTLQELRDKNKFNEFYALFSSGGFLPGLLARGARADLLLERSETQQRTVGKQLYDDYSQQRAALIQLLRAKPYKRSVDDAIRIVQKLLDRIIFIAFCEDRELLPYNAIEKSYNAVAAWHDDENPRWKNFKNLFRSIDSGYPRGNITAYNGGLFKPDPDLDDLELDDDYTDFFREISSYDFKDEVNVDILGHIFEQSVTELESIRIEPAAIAKLAAAAPPTGRRKREGIFYTPRYVTEYIIKHTIGDVLQTRFTKLADRFDVDPAAQPNAKTRPAHLQYQQARLDALGALRVCDPACGSGAFLIEAYEQLEDAYDEVITALCALDPDRYQSLYDEISRTILQENLFGVDLSAEAVEITQLALWLRTAKRGHTLADLSRNIRAGNSLVDDPSFDPRAFDWKTGFERVMAEGGFDCVIGNPPYVKLQNFRKREPRIAEYLVGRYRAAQTGNFDLYLPFIERGIELLKPDGRLGFIAPSLWLFNEYGRGLRELLAETRGLRRFVDFKSHQVFEDATTYTALQVFSRQPAESIEAADAAHGDLKKLASYPVSYTGLSSAPWALLTEANQAVVDRMREGSVTFKEATGQIFQGLITSADAVYHVAQIKPGSYYSKALDCEVELEESILKPLISGKDAVQFATPLSQKYLIFPYTIAEGECRVYTERELKKFRRCWAYLKKNEKRLRGREGGKMDRDGWYGYVYPKNLDKHERPKLFVPRLLYRLMAGADPIGEIYLDNVDVGGVLIRKSWDMYYLLAILNSTACDYIWRLTSKPFRGGYRSANKQFIAPLPIPKSKDQKPLAKLAKELAKLHALRLKTASAVHRRFQTDLPPKQLLDVSPLPATLSGRLSAFDETPRQDLFKHMERLASRKLSPAERTRWDEYLTRQCDAMIRVKRDIADRMVELNDRVYALYGLTKDDRKQIEGAVGPSADTIDGR